MQRRKSERNTGGIIKRGTTAKQRRIVSTLEKLPEEVKKNPMETPAVIVVGEVCGLSDEFNWYEKLTLFGKKLLLQDRGSKPGAGRTVTELGAEVLELRPLRFIPMIIFRMNVI